MSSAVICSVFVTALMCCSWQPNKVEVLPDGLEGIISGLHKLEKGVSNVKLVAHPQETQ